MFDRGMITLSLDDYSALSPFQVMAFNIVEQEIRRFRFKDKPLKIV